MFTRALHGRQAVEMAMALHLARCTCSLQKQALVGKGSRVLMRGTITRRFAIEEDHAHH